MQRACVQFARPKPEAPPLSRSFLYAKRGQRGSLAKLKKGRETLIKTKGWARTKSGRGGEKERECVWERAKERRPIRASGKNERERGRERERLASRHHSTSYFLRVPSYDTTYNVQRKSVPGFSLRSERSVRLPRKLDTSTVSIAPSAGRLPSVSRERSPRDKSAKPRRG